MKVEKFYECGYESALYGLGLSHGLTSKISISDFLAPLKTEKVQKVYDRVVSIANNLANMDEGHNKFLESIYIWLLVQAPRHTWIDVDTYRVGISKNSESTHHTLMKRTLTSEDFESIDINILFKVNQFIENKEYEKLKDNLPEGFLQRRQVCVNYKTLRNFFKQRKKHKHPLLRRLVREIFEMVEHKELFKDIIQPKEQYNESNN